MSYIDEYHSCLRDALGLKWNHLDLQQLLV
jgi:hypothetical protein